MSLFGTPFGPGSGRIHRYPSKDLQVAYCEGYIVAISDILRGASTLLADDLKSQLVVALEEAQQVLDALLIEETSLPPDYWETAQ